MIFSAPIYQLKPRDLNQGSWPALILADTLLLPYE